MRSCLSCKSLVPHPFVKWVGGKGHILPLLAENYPSNKDVSITKYIEPFVGGGAVLFDVLSRFPFESVIINDINARLTNTYIQVRDNIDLIIEELQCIEQQYYKATEKERESLYYENRKRYNQYINPQSRKEKIESAALLIFLNKTCFNGLYRENSSGGFNVPMGKYKHPLICDSKNLLRVSSALQNIEILTGDYKSALEKADEKTFVYLDPPYRPISKTAAFTEYHRAVHFGDKEQRILFEEIQHLNDIGAKILMSNSDPKNTDEKDDFFDSLYGEQFNIKRIEVRRYISGIEKNQVSEILVSNY